jgi:hypothetical protein
MDISWLSLVRPCLNIKATDAVQLPVLCYESVICGPCDLRVLLPRRPWLT